MMLSGSRPNRSTLGCGSPCMPRGRCGTGRKCTATSILFILFRPRALPVRSRNIVSYQRQLSNGLHIGMLVRHGLRHTALTWVADAGVDLHILQRSPDIRIRQSRLANWSGAAVAGRYRRRQRMSVEYRAD
jgi:hypothetical protein